MSAMYRFPINSVIVTIVQFTKPFFPIIDRTKLPIWTIRLNLSSALQSLYASIISNAFEI